MELQLVSFAQAKALKELGYPQSIMSKGEVFDIRTQEPTSKLNYFMIYGDDGYYISAPTLELAAKWLREVKCIDLWVRRLYSWTPKEGTRKVGYHFEGDWQTEVITRYPTYEEALSAGIDKAIKILKEK